MVASDLDPKFTFESFVMRPANRLAAAAARRVSDAPGTSY
ncbi:MAG: DnaA/Hda family protein [Gemmatimonadota bacterium]|nr:DnaA/Hda family protein [Gemmatimonadota bacterium]